MFTKPSLLNLSLLFVLSVISIDRAHAITITTPSDGDSWDLSQPTTITWSAVETDPSVFSVQLVNQVPGAYPTGYKQTIAKDVQSSLNKLNVDNIDGVKIAKGYQIDFITTNGGILAQSAQFSITKLKDGSSSDALSSNTTNYNSSDSGMTSYNQTSTSVAPTSVISGNGNSSTRNGSSGVTVGSSVNSTNKSVPSAAANAAVSAHGWMASQNAMAGVFVGIIMIFVV